MPRFNTLYDSLNLDALRQLCVREGVSARYGRGDKFLSEGECCRRLGLIESGYFKYVVETTDGKEAISGFVFGGEFVADFSNSILDLPTQVSVVAGERCVVKEVEIDSVKELCAVNNAELERAIMHAIFRTIYTRFLDLYRMSPKERYEKLTKAHPKLLQDVPLREVASYLQISPIHLSRIRRKMLRQ